MKKVEIRCKLPEHKRDKINIISSIRKISVNDILERCIDDIINNSEELKALEKR